MKIRMILTGLILMASVLMADDVIEINFFNKPAFDFFEFDLIETRIKTLFNDSINTNIFCGDILKETESDIFVLAFLNAIGCDYAVPTDYSFRTANRNLNFRILASNISSDSLQIVEDAVIESDSMKVGIFSLYTPDFMVKKNIDPGLDFNYHVFDIAAEKAAELSARTDFVIMISNLSRYIDNDVVHELPVDFVFSFDYQIKENGLLSNGRTYFANLDSSRGNFGKLRLQYRNNEIIYSWEELEFKD